MIAHGTQLSQHTVATAGDRCGASARSSRVSAMQSPWAAFDGYLVNDQVGEFVEHVGAPICTGSMVQPAPASGGQRRPPAGSNASIALSSRHRPHRGGVVSKLRLRIRLGRINAHID
jgi:hypothetical protein